MGRTLTKAMMKLPAKRRARVQSRADELVAEELSLQELRRSMQRTQVEMAKSLKVGQDAISRYEQRTDMFLSTLEAYVAALGGELDLIARFPDRPPIRIRTLKDLG